MTDADQHADPPSQAPPLPGGDGSDRVVAALTHLERSAARDGKASWQETPAWQKACLLEWADPLGLLLDADAYLSRAQRGGQEHDVIIEADRYLKITRHGVFGFTPGIELALVSSSQDARRFHLWEATPYLYLERLHLQNLLTPDLNSLVGLIVQYDELSIVIAQPRLDLNPVTETEIGAWLSARGFQKIASAAYYRREDNLGIFDAHDKNVVRATGNPDLLIPFDVIPCHPDGGFLQFIEDTLAAGHTVHAVRSTHTT